MTIVLNDRRVRYVASAGQTKFDVDFPIDTDADVAVYHKVDLTGVITKLTLTTDYTVTLDGAAPNTADVDLVVGAAVNDIITIEGDASVDRASDFTVGGDFFAGTVNNAEDRQYRIDQETKRDRDRTVVANRVSPDTFDPTLPDVVGEALKHIRLNTGETGLEFASISGTGTAVLSDATPATPTAAGTPGTSEDISRSDHEHPLPGQGSGITASGDDLALDIVGLASLGAAPAMVDTIPIHDIGAGLNKEMTVANLYEAIENLTNIAPALLTDEFPIFDTIGNVEGKLTLQEVLNAINLLGIITPDTAADFIPIYDADGAIAGKVLIDNLGISGGFTLETEIATSSGSSVTFSGLPSGITDFDVTFEDLGMVANNADVYVQLGDSGGIEASGYASVGAIYKTAPSMTSEIITNAFQYNQLPSANTLTGGMNFKLKDAANNTWICTGHAGQSGNPYQYQVMGSKSLSGELTQVKILPETGDFDGGSVGLKSI